MKKNSRRKEMSMPLGATIIFGLSDEEAVAHAAEHAQEAADDLNIDVPVVNGFTGEKVALVRPRRVTGVSLAGLKEDDYMRIFGHTNFRGSGKVQ